MSHPLRRSRDHAPDPLNPQDGRDPTDADGSSDGKQSSPGPRCSNCRDTGYLDRRPLRYCRCSAGREHHQRRQRRIMKVYTSCGRPDRFEGLTMAALRELAADHPEKLESVRRAERILEGHSAKNSLLLAGPSGAGKTSLATAMLEHQFERGYPVLWIKYRELIREVGAVLAEKKRSDDLRLTTARQVPVLVIDGLGEPWTDDLREPELRQEALYEVISYRHEWCLPTYLTVNHCDPRGVLEQLEPALADRLAEMCHLQVMGGENLRMLGWD